MTPQQVVDLWRQNTLDIPARFALGTAQHESDLDPGSIARNDGGSGRDSIGLYQVSRAEAGLVLTNPLADLTDPTTNTKVYASLCSARLFKIKVAAGLVGTPSDQLPADIWAYLAMDHNLGGAVTSILSYGLDWNAYKARNSGAVWSEADQAKHPSRIAGTPTGAAKFCDRGYGDDVISGGRYWSADFDALPPPAVPPSTGLAVRALLLLVAAVGLYFAFRPWLKGVLA